MVQKNLFRLTAFIWAMAFGLFSFNSASACTGISFIAKDGSKVIARTMEWGGFYMESRYVIVPRGHSMTAMTPSGTNGMKIVAKYGYVGIGVLKENFIAEGMNEKGLAGELFYFPGYGKYEEYNPAYNSTTLVDAQFLSWLLGNFATISDMEKEINNIHIAGYGHGFGNVHFNIADVTGRQVVLEVIDGKVKLFENKVGVITNAPSFDWHVTNLNNYVNIFAGGVEKREFENGLTLEAFGVGAGGLGLPGDVTPPSRFIRAAYYVASAPKQETGYKTVMQTFQILNNFDVPIGAEFKASEEIPDMLSATQWTASLDLKGLKFYYHTAWNGSIRCIDLKEINFEKVEYQERALDKVKEQPVEYIKIK